MNKYSNFNNDQNIIILHKKNLFAYVSYICSVFKVFNSNNCFYFPQRILTAIFVSIFTLIYCAFSVTSYVFDIISTVITLQNAISNKIFSFIIDLFETIALKLNYELKDSYIEIYYSTINKFIVILTNFQY